MRFSRFFGGSVIALVLAAFMPAAVAAAPTPITFSYVIGQPGDCIGLTLPAHAPWSFVLKDPSGNEKASASSTDTEGFEQLCIHPSLAVEIGDRFRATSGDSARNYVVPDLSIQLDRFNDRFEGTGPANRTVKIDYVVGIFGDFQQTRAVRVRADGSWSWNPPFDIIGGQFAGVRWTSPNGDSVSANTIAPYIVIKLNRAGFFGYAARLQNVHARVGTGIGTGIGDADPADATGYFEGRFRAEHGQPVPARAGDPFEATISPDAEWIIPNVRGNADADTNVVSGRCGDTGQSLDFVVVQLFRAGGLRGRTFTNTEPDGRFSFDFTDVGGPGSDPANVQSGDRIVFQCWQDTGDRVQLAFSTP